MVRKLAITLLLLGFGLVSWDFALPVDGYETLKSRETTRMTMEGGIPIPPPGQ